MINRDTWSPVIRPLGASYDANLDPSLRGILVKAPGTLVVEDIDGETAVIPFAALDPSATGEQAHTLFPHCLMLQIRKIIGDGAGGVGNGTTGTDIDLADLVGLA